MERKEEEKLNDQYEESLKKCKEKMCNCILNNEITKLEFLNIMKNIKNKETNLKV